MHTTGPITHHRGADAVPEPPADRLIAEPLNLLDAVPVAGPPAILLAGPLVLLALMVAGPFVVVLTLVALLVGATALAALGAALVASPYLLARHLHGRRA